VWNGWKGQLLRTLYHETEPLLSGGHTQVPRGKLVADAQAELRAALSDWPEGDVDRFIERHYPEYWLRTEPKRQVDHARLLRRAEREERSFAAEHATYAFTAITELTVFAPNHPRLLSLFAGACAANGANIVGAHITTTRDGFALDTFLLAREFPEDEDENRRAKRIEETIERLLRGDTWVAQLLEKRRFAPPRVEAFKVAPEVYVNNVLSDAFTVIEVTGRDRTGLLYELTNALSDLSLDIASAHVTTFGEKAVDVFYVTDLTSKKIESESRQQAIKDRLTAILAGPTSS
jgi:[protein-PII] uridylyltransferase